MWGYIFYIQFWFLFCKNRKLKVEGIHNWQITDLALGQFISLWDWSKINYSVHVQGAFYNIAAQWCVLLVFEQQQRSQTEEWATGVFWELENSTEAELRSFRWEFFRCARSKKRSSALLHCAPKESEHLRLSVTEQENCWLSP